MRPETKEALDDLEYIAKGLSDAIENIAVSGEPPQFTSMYINAADEPVSERIVSKQLVKLLVSGLYSELRNIESYVTRRMEMDKEEKADSEEILNRIREIRKEAF